MLRTDWTEELREDPASYRRRWSLLERSTGIRHLPLCENDDDATWTPVACGEGIVLPGPQSRTPWRCSSGSASTWIWSKEGRAVPLSRGGQGYQGDRDPGYPTHLTVPQTVDAQGVDMRSVLVLVEPQLTSDGFVWHGMAFAGGKVVNNITGIDRTVVLDDCLCALAGADIDVEVE